MLASAPPRPRGRGSRTPPAPRPRPSCSGGFFGGFFFFSFYLPVVKFEITFLRRSSRRSSPGGDLAAPVLFFIKREG